MIRDQVVVTDGGDRPGPPLALAELRSDRLRLIREADVQCLARGRIDRLGRDLDRLDRARRSALGSVGGYEARLSDLRRLPPPSSCGPGGVGGADPDRSWAISAGEVDAELRSRRANAVGGEFTACLRCGRRVLSEMRTAHESQCRSLGGTVHAEGSDLPPPRTEPQPPRNLRLVSVTHDCITVAWEDPILDGGSPIYDYQLSFCRYSIKRTGKREIRKAERMPPVKMSRWCLSSPVPQKEFQLSHFEASVEYSNLRLRCRNEVGWSGHSEPLLVTGSVDGITVKMAGAVKPTVPLFFGVGDVSSNSIEFLWGAPFNNGGVPLEKYELHFIMVVPKDNQVVGGEGDSKKTEERNRVLELGCDCTKFCLSSLRGGTLTKAIKFRVVNKAGLKSDFVTCSDVTTLKANFRELLQNEIKRVRASEEEFIDSDTLTGVLQRVEKWKYLSRLEDELKRIPKASDGSQSRRSSITTSHLRGLVDKEETKRRVIESTLVDTARSVSDGETTAPSDIVPNFRRRKSQFLYRMKRIDEEITELEVRRNEVSNRRHYLTQQLARAQARILVVNAEVDRVANFPGRNISSGVLHSAEQRFDVRQLKKELQVELRKVRSNMSEWKYEIIAGEKEGIELVNLMELKKEALKDRKARYQEFEYRAECTTNVKRFMSSSPDDTIRRYLQTWFEKCINRRKLKKALVTMEYGSKKRTFSHYLKAWKDATQVCAANVEVGINYKIVGAGGALLLQTEIEQNENIASTSSVIQHLATIKSLQSSCMVECSGCDDKDLSWFLSTADNTLLTKANFYFDTEKHHDALRCYRDLLDNMCNDSYHEVPRQDIGRMYSDLYGRCGQTEMKLENLNSANVTLDRSLSIARELGSDSQVGHAFLVLGQCHVAREEFSYAIHNFCLALASFFKTSDLGGKVAAYRALHECYDQMNALSHATDILEKLNMLIYNREIKMTSAIENMDRLRQRLINMTAEAGKKIMLQKATPHYVQLKKDKLLILHNIENAKSGLSECVQETERLKKILLEIQGQLAEAQATTQKKMISSLVHESTQEFEVEELITRLQARHKDVENVIFVGMGKKDRLSTEIKNMHDDIQCLNADLAVEEGPLMQRVLQNRQHIRCMALSASNTASNDVTGGATNGTDLLVLSEGKDLYVHNLVSGDLELVFPGDNEGKHVGDAVGHTSIITCIFFFGSQAFTGSMDTTVMCWDVKQEKRLFTCRGHEATITCIHVDDSRIVSGSADTLLCVWNRMTGELIQRVRGHSRGVLCLSCGPNWCVSGDSDGLIFMWDDEFRCKQRLSMKESKITVVRYGELEVISGDNKGYVSIWWLKTGEAMRRCKAHDGPVLDLQVDATRVVSCGMDKNVQVVDILTGKILQTLRGHEDTVLAVVFDCNLILSASCDGTLRQWPWTDSWYDWSADRTHTYSVGETLPDIAKIYGSSVSDIKKWNGLKDAIKLHSGKKLIVQKTNPNEPTEARREAKKSRMVGAVSRVGKFGGIKQDRECELGRNKFGDRIENSSKDLHNKSTKVKFSNSVDSSSKHSEITHERTVGSAGASLSLRLQMSALVSAE